MVYPGVLTQIRFEGTYNLQPNMAVDEIDKHARLPFDYMGPIDDL